jgi:hypothetical protein
VGTIHELFLFLLIVQLKEVVKIGLVGWVNYQFLANEISSPSQLAIAEKAIFNHL